ncbi:glycosyltransferase family 9 protein [Aestuariibaculum lutulentum]|uniref:Glycosyltransferase family 9 protein n=1 Tax=Aestuariibaculum lutulentum TaxID=2920935 RepID=A0ABS9RGL7_9FLAO|nr:glycosyltransferase family 9 protein [Aestuariibaculum lutulentum]MCH4552092.1 glycosyltransferase family 9 protein [Aestuariibaculum lutulentum]
MPKSPEHILVIRLSAMGDVAMTVPVLRAFTKQYPLVKVTVLTRGFFMPFFKGISNVNVFPADLKGKHKGVFGLHKLSKELKALGVTQVADLHNVLRTNILKTFFFGTKVVQIDKGRSEKKALVSGDIFQQLKTTHQRYADVFNALGYPVDLSNPIFPKPSELTINGFENKSEKWIGIAPFAAHEGKMYPLVLMKEVIAELSNDYRIILFGGGTEEAQILDGIAQSFDNVINTAGQLKFDEELAVISNLDVMLAMDSGNAHMAAMQGVKVITIWGVTHPYAGFAPFNQPEDYALVADRNQFPLVPTSIYGNKYPEGYEKASASISSQRIIEKIKAVI